MSDELLKRAHREDMDSGIEQREDDILTDKIISKVKTHGIRISRNRTRHSLPFDSVGRKKDTILTTQGLHTNNNSHFFLKRARFSGTPIRESAPSSITYDRTLDHTSAGSGLACRGRGSSGSKTSLPGVRASGLGCKKIAGVSVYMPARLMMCMSGVISFQAGEDEEAGRPRDVAIIVRPIWTGCRCGCVPCC